MLMVTNEELEAIISLVTKNAALWFGRVI